MTEVLQANYEGIIGMILVNTVLTLIFRIFVFQKMGIVGLKALVPLFGTYKMTRKLTNERTAWLAVIIIAVQAVYPLNQSFMSMLVILMALLMELYLSHLLSQSFNHGWGFAFGICLFPVVFYAILAFRKKEVFHLLPGAVDRNPEI